MCVCVSVHAPNNRTNPPNTPQHPAKPQLQFLLDVILAVETAFIGDDDSAAAASPDAMVGEKLKEGAPAVALDCTFAALDVLEGMMEARFIKELGEDLDRPFDEEGSFNIYRALAVALRLLVAVISLDGYNPLLKEGEGGFKGKRGKLVGSPMPTAQTPLAEHPSLSSPRNLLAPKSFTFEDPEAKASGGLMVHTKVGGWVRACGGGGSR